MSLVAWRSGESPSDVAARFRARYPETPATVPIVLRALRGRPASHPLFAVERADGGPGRLLLKVPRRSGARPHGPATEYRVLNDIAPAIARENSATRCPEVLERYGDPPAILMEMLEGAITLKALAFGLARQREIGAATATALAGEWLARFHRLTAAGMGEPVGVLRDRLAALPIRGAIERHTARGTVSALERHLDRLAGRAPGPRRPRCLVHGFFVAEHVLVHHAAVYIVDLESCRPGFGLEDLAAATVWPQLLMPWRRALGRWRGGPGGGDAALLAGYAAVAGPLGADDVAMLRMARVLTAAEWIARVDFTERGWRDAARRLCGWPLWCRRFRALCRRELAHLSRT